MEKIITAFATLFVLLVAIFAGTGVMTVSSEVARAKEYKADVIAEIENSNFNQVVIDACIDQAKNAGYELEVLNTIYDADNNITTAEVILSYEYDIPIFGIHKTHETRGIAR